MRPSRSCLAMLVTLMLLTGLAGCGPASSDNTPSLGPNASMDGPSLSKQGSSPRNDAFTSAASPVSLASANGTGTGTVSQGDSSHAVPVIPPEPGHPVDNLVVPAWVAKELDSPDARVRLRALESWVQSAPPGMVDRLILALEDKDERVRARAMELVEQAWAREAEAEK